MHKQFNRDREAVVARAAAAGVRAMVLTGCSLRGSAEASAYAARARRGTMFSTVGVHAHDAKSLRLPADLPRFRSMLAAPHVVAVGECGLDFNRNFSARDVQVSGPSCGAAV